MFQLPAFSVLLCIAQSDLPNDRSAVTPDTSQYVSELSLTLETSDCLSTMLVPDSGRDAATALRTVFSGACQNCALNVWC